MLGNLRVGTIAWLSHLLVVGCIHVHRHAHAQQRQQEQRENRDIRFTSCTVISAGMSSFRRVALVIAWDFRPNLCQTP